MCEQRRTTTRAPSKPERIMHWFIYYIFALHHLQATSLRLEGGHCEIRIRKYCM